MSFVATTRKWPKRRILSSSEIDSNPLVRLYIEGMFSLRLTNEHEQNSGKQKQTSFVFYDKIECTLH